jgi:hypothetical protein
MSDLEKLPSHPGFFKVINPLYVFKKAYTPTSRDGVIINLIIPKGAIIFPGNTPGGCLRTTVSVGMQGSGKLRASKAIVHSISTFKRKFNLYDEYNEARYVDDPIFKKKQVKRAIAGWDTSFSYQVGKTVEPRQPFSFSAYECESGIHFFFKLSKALNWS